MASKEAKVVPLRSAGGCCSTGNGKKAAGNSVKAKTPPMYGGSRPGKPKGASA